MKQIKFLDPAIKRKSEIIEDTLKLIDNKFPLPSYVEISNSGVCNRKCSFCPRSDPTFLDIHEFITFELIEKLSRQLSSFNFNGRILFSGFVEPLLDKKIFEKIELIKKFLPKAKVDINTNGDVLKIKIIKKLFNHGLDTLLISVYDSKEDAKRFEKMCKDSFIKENQYVIRHRYYKEDKDFGITLSNRAGMMENAEYKIKKLEKSLKLSCYYPSYTFFLDYTGDVLMCPHDWGKKLILGNLENQDFIDIWLSNAAIQSRKRLNNKDRHFSPCDVCDVAGTLMGKTHAKVWENIDEK
jgi:radical SAM protein with 4Fe4S-binding SPASM domain